MSRKTDALIKLAVAMGYGESASDYSGKTTVDVLREIAVKMQVAPSTENIRAYGIVGLLNYIADNYGSEEVEPYNLTKTESHATVAFQRKGETISAGNDILYNGDKVKITATGATGYDVTSLTVNNVAFTSGNEYTVNGHNVAVAVSGTLKTFDLARTATNCTITVTKDGNAVADGEGVLAYGDELTVTITANAGYEVSDVTLNGTTFAYERPFEITVKKNVTITAIAVA